MQRTLRNWILLIPLCLLVWAWAFACWGAEAENWLTEDGNGWSQTPVDPSARVVYVSSSDGDDGDDGLSEANAKATIAAGVALLRNNMGDHLLLKCGDTWTDERIVGLPTGKDATYPTVVSYYGSGARPKLGATTGTEPLIKDSHCNWVAIIGIHLDGSGRTGNDYNGFILGNLSANNVLVEGCLITEVTNNSIQGNTTTYAFAADAVFRRNVVLRDYGTAHSQGLFVNFCDGLLIEENILDHNGWEVGGTGSTFDHNVYCGDLVRDSKTVGNVFSRGATMGLKLDVDGGTHTVANNLFVRNGLAGQLAHGIVDGYSPSTAGVTLYAYNNVVVEGSDESGVVEGGGRGFTIQNIAGGYFRSNIMANSVSNPFPNIAYSLHVRDRQDGIGINNFTIADNVFYNLFSRLKLDQATNSNLSTPTFSNNAFTGNEVQEPGAITIEIMESTDTQGVIGSYSFSDNTYYSTRSTTDGWFVVSLSSVLTDISTANWQSTYEATATFSQITTYTDATRDVTDYITDVRMDTDIDDLAADWEALTIDNWDSNTAIMADAINDYIREGFSKPGDPFTEYEPPAPAGSKRVLFLK